MYLNKLNNRWHYYSDLHKDGSTVGTIGSYVGSHLRIGSGASNLLFADPNEIIPSTSSGAASNGLIDLGSTGRRFKDLYLAGGVYLGGTGAANKLDDYEEGTWTPTLYTSGGGESISITSPTGRYTKVGNKVTVTIYTASLSITSAGSGSARIGGLPFTCSGGDQSYACPSFAHTNCFAQDPEGYVVINDTFIVVTQAGQAIGNSFVTGTKYLMFTVTYFTDQ